MNPNSKVAALTPLPAEVTEVEVIGALLARLPEADVAELVTLASTCPASNVQALLPRLERVLAELRDRLTDVIAEAYREAHAAEEWIASLEALAEAELVAASA